MTKLKCQIELNNPPLKIRGVRGVMRIAQVTPFVPLTLRGRYEGRGGFGI